MTNGLPDGPTEDSTDRDGVLSYAAEWHAFTHGVYNSLARKRPHPPKELPDDPDIQAEPHYYKGGWIIGTLLHAVLVLALGIGVQGAGVYP